MATRKHINLTYTMYSIEPASRRLKSMERNKTIENIFNFLSERHQVNTMIEVTKDGRPAIEGIIETLENQFPFNAEFNLESNYRYRQIIGSMVRFIMGHYGYMAGKATKVKKGHYIQSAIVYKKY